MRLIVPGTGLFDAKSAVAASSSTMRLPPAPSVRHYPLGRDLASDACLRQRVKLGAQDQAYLSGRARGLPVFGGGGPYRWIIGR